ncbi:MAG: RNA-binding protein [Proteobacteria bacterium]|nr:RNA-binding protein [Pseudomonadota bacterium]
MSEFENKVRLDKWLWAARFFKTRVLASAAVNGGKVHRNGQRIKPAQVVRIEDRYEILHGHDRLEVIVTGLSQRRGSAQVAQTLYQETEMSQERRQHEAEQRKLAAMQKPVSIRRPNKRERRKIRQFTGGI